MVEMADLQTSEGLDPKEPIPPSDDEEIYLSASDDEIPSSEESDEYEDQEDVPQNGAKPEQAEMPQIAPTYIGQLEMQQKTAQRECIRTTWLS